MAPPSRAYQEPHTGGTAVSHGRGGRLHTRPLRKRGRPGRAWLFARVRNTQQGWESNDLIDGMYLCCAAGYADLVVGERNAIGYLRQGRDCPLGAELTASLSEAVTVLERLV